MAAPTPRSYFAGTNYRFLPTDQIAANDSVVFELDESDVWNCEPQSRSPDSSSRMSRKVSASGAAVARGGGPASLPVNVPDWSKILKHEYRENRRKEEDYDWEVEEEDDRIPPHVFLARARMASLSVQEGIGRTLKGRDLSRVRNAIWQKTGFQD